MPVNLKGRLIALLRWSERYFKTDMVYLAQSNFWLQATSFFVSLGSFLLYIVFGNVLPKEVYGTYQYLLSIGAIVAAFTLTGMNSAVIRAVSRGFEGTYREAIAVQLRWNVVPMLGSWLVSMYYLTHGNTQLAAGFGLIGLFVPLNAALNTYTAYLAGKKDFKRSFGYSLIVNLPYYLAVALVAISVPFALALLAANFIAQTTGFFIAHRNVLKQYQPNDTRDPEAIIYGRHLSIINFLTAAVAQADNVLVFHFLGPANLALYSFATAVPDRLGIFKQAAIAAFPKFATRTSDEARPGLARKALVGIALAAGIAFVYAAIARPFFALFFPHYLGAVPFSQAYALVIIASFSPLFTTFLTAQGHVRALYAYNTISPLLQLILLFLGIATGGLWGLIIARILNAILASVLAAGFVYAGRNLS